MWGIIKKTLNSTIGTPDFTPLNEIIENSLSLTASDDVLYSIGDAQCSGQGVNGYISIFEKKINISGRMRLSASTIRSNGSLAVVLNGTLVTVLSSNGSYVDFDISKNDVLTIRLYQTSLDWSEATGVKLSGTVMVAPYQGIFIE